MIMIMISQKRRKERKRRQNNQNKKYILLVFKIKSEFTKRKKIMYAMLNCIGFVII